MFSHLAGKASFVNYLPRLTQATSDDGEPTPGYLLDEITKITYQSTSSSHQLVDYLLHRLNKSSTPVKIKVLKIIVYLINNGHKSFRQQLRQNDGSIKSTVLHSGPADPMLGNTLYKEVQKLAEETLDLLFNPEIMKDEEALADDQDLPCVESSPVFMSGMGATARGGGKYEGFGNAMKEKEGTVTDKMLDYLGRLIHPSDDQTSEVIRAALHSSPGDYQPVAVAGALIDPVFSAEVPTPKASFIKNHVPGRAGGGWESDEDEHNEGFGPAGSQITSETTTDVQSDISICTQQQNESLSADITLSEAQDMLIKFCRGSGLPSIDELDEVCARCTSLSCSQTIPTLSNIIPDFNNSLSKGECMRILLLLEWLYHNDCVMVQTQSKDAVKFLDKMVEDLDMAGPCKSKAKKLRLFYEKSQNTASDQSNSQIAAN